MSAQQRIKVSVAELVKAIEAKRASVVAEHEAVKARGKAQAGTVKRAVVEGLTEALKKAKTGDFPAPDSGSYKRLRDGSWGSLTRVTVEIDLPVTWDDFQAVVNDTEANTSQMDRDLAALKLAAEPTITIATDSNFFKYLA